MTMEFKNMVPRGLARTPSAQKTSPGEVSECRMVNRDISQLVHSPNKVVSWQRLFAREGANSADTNLVQGGCIEAAYEGKQGGDVIGFDEWFEINLLKEYEANLTLFATQFPLTRSRQAPFGPMCTAWLAKDYTVCGTDKKLDVLGQVGIVLASLVYYYAAGTYYHATQKGRKRSLDSVKWDVDPNTLEWPEIPADAEEVKRAIVVLDEAGNELARTETRSIVELDEAGNVPSGDKVKAKAFKRGAVELDGAGNVLSMDKLRRAVLELDVDGNELFGSKE